MIRILLALLLMWQWGCRNSATTAQEDAPVAESVSPEAQLEEPSANTVEADTTDESAEQSGETPETSGGLGLRGSGNFDSKDFSKVGGLGKSPDSKPQIQGSLTKDQIRRVVQQHRSEIAYCYEKELSKDPSLAGRVTVRFTISASGSVVSAVVRDTTLNNAEVEACVTNSVRRWVFPEPDGGGIVIVNYPFNFLREPGQDE